MIYQFIKVVKWLIDLIDKKNEMLKNKSVLIEKNQLLGKLRNEENEEN